MTEESIKRRTLTLDGRGVSYLYAGEGSPVLLLHGTFWSRVWSRCPARHNPMEDDPERVGTALSNFFAEMWFRTSFWRC